MITFPEQYEETCKQFLQAFWHDRTWQVEQSVLGVQIPLVMPETLYQSALADNLADIARAATGDMPYNEDRAGEIYEGIQQLMEWLFAAPGLTSTYTIPSSFWETPLGQMVGRAFVWVRQDELITISEAASILKVTGQAITNKIKSGDIRGYVNLAAPERQGRTMVARSEIEALLE